MSHQMIIVRAEDHKPVEMITVDGEGTRSSADDWAADNFVRLFAHIEETNGSMLAEVLAARKDARIERYCHKGKQKTRRRSVRKNNFASGDLMLFRRNMQRNPGLAAESTAYLRAVCD